jgi:hypothetical protein
MSFYLGNVALDAATTSIREEQEEVGGRDARLITITGVVAAADVEARLDAIMAAAAGTNGVVELGIRPGRRLLARRQEGQREVAADGRTGAFKLVLTADNPFEEAAEATSAAWDIDANGDTATLTTSGNAPTPLSIEITATSTLITPSFSNGADSITYDGVMESGDVLCVDGERFQATLNGADVTPYVTGTRIWVSPDGIVVSYNGAAGSGHSATAIISYRDRWW